MKIKITNYVLFLAITLELLLFPQIGNAEPILQAATSQEQWVHIAKEIEYTYFTLDKKRQAITDLEENIISRKNTYSNKVLNKFLGILAEYFELVNSGNLNQFRKIVYHMFYMKEEVRVDYIVDFFSIKYPTLYQSASNARREYYDPDKLEIRIRNDISTLNIGDTVSYILMAWNKHEIKINPDYVNYPVKVTNKHILELNSAKQTVVALNEGECSLILEDNQSNRKDIQILTVLPDVKIRIEPETISTFVDSTVDFKVISDREIQNGKLHAFLEPEDAANLELYDPSPGSNKQTISFKGKNSYKDIKLKVSLDDDYTFASIKVKPNNPSPPSKRNVTYGSIVTLGSILYSYKTQSDANEKRDEEEVAGKTPGVSQFEIDRLHAKYKTAQNKATVFWMVTTIAAGVTYFIFYKNYKKDYNRYLNEKEKVNKFSIGFDLKGKIQLAYNL